MGRLDDALNSLKKIVIEDLGKNIVALGMVRDLSVEGNAVSFTLKVPASLKEREESLKEQALNLLKGAGFDLVNIKIEETKAPPPRVGVQQKEMKRRIEGVKSIIAIASGKGGVGKSAVAANLAVALKEIGLKVSLLDGDIYGPSIPKMFGIENEELRIVNEKIEPIFKFGVKVLSIGLLIEEDTPIIWRGPLLHKAYQQFFFDVNWQDTDIMVIDLPPGTGDAQISVMQLLELAGGIAVTTPQDVALSDVKKAIRMFEKMNVPVIGVIENMSVFICPHCGKETRIFGKGGGRKLEQEMGVRLLTELPLDPMMVESGDKGIPVVIHAPRSRIARAFIELAERLREILSIS